MNRVRYARRALMGMAIVGIFAACGGPTDSLPGPVTTVNVAPGLDTLVSLTETVQLRATARDANGTTVPGTAFTWLSDDASIASVSSDGMVTAQANGTTTIRASAGSVAGTATLVVAQAAAIVDATQGDLQAATVGFPLDTAIVATLTDALGSAISGSSITFAIVAGGGTVDPAAGITDSIGQVTVSWTMGTVSGVQELSAAVTADTSHSYLFTATAFASDPDSMLLLDGDAQFELVSLALPKPIRVKLIDEYGNGVPYVPVTMSTSGDAMLDTTEVFSDLDGIATVTWTLGSSLGAYTAQALVPDSAVGAIVNLAGSPVNFSATAVAFSLGAVTPTPAVVGQTMTVNGMGFDPDSIDNTVTVDGTPAVVTTWSQTSLTVRVPSFGCSPVQSRTVEVTRGGATLSTVVTVHPANVLSLAVGERRMVVDPADFCLQFLPASTGGDEYVVGISATRALNAEFAYSMTSSHPTLAPPPLAAAPPASSPFEATASVASEREFALRSWEQEFFRTPRAFAKPAAAQGASLMMAVPNVGDVIDYRVPDITTDPCTSYTAVSATVIGVGPRAVVATDASLPTGAIAQAAIAAALDTFMTMFGDKIYAVATTYFGLPTDLDADQRITVLLSSAVNSMGVPAFTTAVDLLPRATCASSDEREIVYVAIPAVPSLIELTDLFDSAPPHIAHDVTHLIQLARRLSVGGNPLPLWLGEGQAEFGTEIIGMAVRGDTSQMDYGAAVVNAGLLTALWYEPRFERMAYLFGWDGATGKILGAPARCSLFGFGGVASPCVDAYTSGATWSFVRYVTDRIASVYANGEAGFHQDLIGLDPTGDVTALLETATGATLADLMLDWAAALYVDGRVSPADAPLLQLTSWDLADVFASRSAEQRLVPDSTAFVPFSVSGSVAGGGTSYTLITDTNAHDALAVRVRDPADGVLSAMLQPRVWVVRIR